MVKKNGMLLGELKASVAFIEESVRDIRVDVKENRKKLTKMDGDYIKYFGKLDNHIGNHKRFWAGLVAISTIAVSAIGALIKWL